MVVMKVKKLIWYRTYGGYEGQEADLISTSALIGLVSLKFDGGTGMYTLDRNDKVALDLHVQNEGRRHDNAHASSAGASSAPTGPLQKRSQVSNSKLKLLKKTTAPKCLWQLEVDAKLPDLLPSDEATPNVRAL
jgi:hypothetical protein